MSAGINENNTGAGCSTTNWTAPAFHMSFLKRRHFSRLADLAKVFTAWRRYCSELSQTRLAEILEVLMRRLSIGSSVLILVAAQSGFAQQTHPADDFKPCSTNIVGQQYPQVNSEHRVKFRISAPNATSIRVLGQSGQGRRRRIYRFTAPQDPGFHYYQITIDGVAVADPSSESFFGTGKMRAASRSPKLASTSMTTRTCRTARFASRWYKAKSDGDSVRPMVYTPPGYDKDPTQALPGAVPAAWRGRG